MLRGAPVCGAAGVRALGPRPQRLLPLLLPAALRGGPPLGAEPGLLSPRADPDVLRPPPYPPPQRGRSGAGGARSQASPWRRIFRGGLARRLLGPPATRLALQYDYFRVWEVSLLFCVCSYPDSILKFTINVLGLARPTALLFGKSVPWAPSETRVRAHPERVISRPEERSLRGQKDSAAGPLGMEVEKHQQQHFVHGCACFC